MWQRYWDSLDRGFLMIGVAQDIQGLERVLPVVEERGVEFPVLLDPTSELGQKLNFKIVPAGFFIDPDGRIVYRHENDFDIGDPRVKASLRAFISGEGELESPEGTQQMSPEALRSFAQGVALYSAGNQEGAIRAWRAALEIDPDNFIIRSQIWAVEHPEHFYPAVDRDWQVQQLMREGYDKPLP